MTWLYATRISQSPTVPANGAHTTTCYSTAYWPTWMPTARSTLHMPPCSGSYRHQAHTNRSKYPIATRSLPVIRKKTRLPTPTDACAISSKGSSKHHAMHALWSLSCPTTSAPGLSTSPMPPNATMCH